jgi:O-antigen/teichoic acid export membrane protein
MKKTSAFPTHGFSRLLGSSRFASGAAVAFARIFSLIAAAVQLPILTRTLSPHDYAFLVAAMAGGTYASLVSVEAPSLAFQRFPGDSDNRGRYRFARRQYFQLTIAVLCLSILFVLFFGYQDIVLAAIGWGSGLAAMRIVSTAWLMWGSPWRYALTLAASTAMRTIVLILLIEQRTSPMLAVSIAGLSSALVVLFLSPKLRHVTLPARPWPRFTGTTLALGSIGITILANFDLMVLPHLTAPEEAGRYAAMTTLATLSIGAAASMISTAVFPRALRDWEGGREWAVRTTCRRVQLFILAMGTAGICTSLLVGETVLGHLLGSRYAAAPLLACLLAAVTAYALGQQASWIHNLGMHAHVIRNSVILAVIVNILLIFVLTPRLGAYGAAIASIACYATYAGAMLLRASLGLDVGIGLLLISILGISSLVPSARTVTVVVSVVACLFYCLRLSITFTHHGEETILSLPPEY